MCIVCKLMEIPDLTMKDKKTRSCFAFIANDNENKKRNKNSNNNNNLVSRDARGICEEASWYYGGADGLELMEDPSINPKS